MSAKQRPKTQKANANLIVRVPLNVRRRGGKKSVLPPSLPQKMDQPPEINHFVRKLALAFRWRSRIESGEFATITDLAKAEGVNQSYACRLLRLSLLAPALVEVAVEGKLPATTFAKALNGLPNDWSAQRKLLG